MWKRAQNMLRKEQQQCHTALLRVNQRKIIQASSNYRIKSKRHNERQAQVTKHDQSVPKALIAYLYLLLRQTQVTHPPIDRALNECPSSNKEQLIPLESYNLTLLMKRGVINSQTWMPGVLPLLLILLLFKTLRVLITRLLWRRLSG